MGTKQTNRLNESLRNLNAIAADLNAAGKQVSIKRLRTRKPRKGETMQRNSQHGAGYAMGSVRGGDRQTASHAVGGGKGATITRQVGIGAQMVKNLDQVKRNAAATYAADRRAAAKERLMGKIDDVLASL
tara:strand:- start:1295 stop:1684 length:390 start_codon:yes stop_codon:yes gene_type:complete